jgi:mRNA degradation ribonuclease J1/J2
MTLEVCSIGGFSKTEGNSVAIKVDDEVVLLDMGLSMENYIKFQEDMEDVSTKTYRSLLNAGAVPDNSFTRPFRSRWSYSFCSNSFSRCASNFNTIHYRGT